MRVLQINTGCGVGSTGRIATDIDGILKKQGHKSYIAYGRGIPRACDTSIKIGNQIDTYFHIAKTRILDEHGFGSKKATKEIINKIEDLNPDILHLHNIHGYYLNVEFLFEYLKKSDKPVVWTLHDCWPFTGHCTYFDYVSCDKWKTGCYDCPQKKSYPSSILIDNSQSNFIKKMGIFNGVNNMTIVTPSKWLAGLVKQSFLNKYPIKIINNGIDLDVFKNTESNFRNRYKLLNSFIILGVANIWDKRKGLDYFIKLSKMLSSDEVIVLVGLEKKQMADLPNNIIGISRTESLLQLAEIYSAADIFVNPTLEDNFPTTNLEALACGTPVVTFNTGGSIESVDASCGFIVEKGDLDELINKIHLVKMKQKISYSRDCINRAEALYDKKSRFYDYLELYSNVLK